MLDATASERTAQSRLGCQLIITEDLEGLIVQLPDKQIGGLYPLPMHLREPKRSVFT